MKKLSTLMMVVAIVLALSAPLLAQQASLNLSDADMALGRVGCTEWDLDKTNALEEPVASDSTVTWSVDATKVATVDEIIIFGYVKVTNGGSADATIGNVVVDLQRYVAGNKPRWVVASNDVADATNGNAATGAYIALTKTKTYLSENGASGDLTLYDLEDNEIDITEPIVIAPGETVEFLYRAEFDNGVLGLATGDPIRSQIIFTFGYAGPRGYKDRASQYYVDIDGDGNVDSWEEYVRSVREQSSDTLPEMVLCNDSVTLTDDGVTTDGDVTTENFNNGDIEDGIAIGEGDPDGSTYQYEVTVDVDGGDQGGSVTNTANILGSDGPTVGVIVDYIQVGIDPYTLEPIMEPVYHDMLTCEAVDIDAEDTVDVSA